MLKRRHLIAATGAAGLGLPAIVSAQPKNASWPAALNMGTAAPGGTYAIFGPAWGQIAQEATGVNISYRTTQGPNQNIILVNSKEVELGMVTMSVALQGWNGKGQWTQGKQFRDIRALFPMYNTPFHGIALARSGITDHSQLNGKSVGVGPRGGTPGTFYPPILSAIGVTPSAVRYGSGSDLIGQVADGLLDAFLFASGAPIPAFTELETTNEASIFGFTEAQRDAAIKQFPELSKGTLPQSTYRSLKGPILILGVYNFAIVNKSVPNDLVFEIVKSVMTQNPRMVQATAAAKETTPDNWDKNSFLPFHPGAAKWFRENGFAIPDSLVQA